VVAADYPFLDLLWTMFIFFIWIAWIFLVFRVIADVFRRHDVSGGGKVAWSILIILVPFLGVFVYVISQGKQMAERDARQAQAAQSQFDDYVRSVGGGDSVAQIEKAKQLLDSGTISEAEFQQIKAKALA
jgi:predicted PurR-regulated permease PerM